MTSLVKSTIAKLEDGEVQITFTIPQPVVSEAKDKALVQMAETVEVPGFRKGKAPLDQVAQKVNPEELMQRTLGFILPEALADAITVNKLRIAIYPKFELVKAAVDSDWEVKATTCEIPDFELGDYKAIVKKSAPKEKEKGKGVSREEKEQAVLKSLTDNIKVIVPKLLIESEVDARLSNLLDRLEKLGLTLEGYLNSMNKTPETIREEYGIQAKEAISLDLILEKIAGEEKITVKDEQIDEVLKQTANDPKVYEKMNTPEQRRFIASILRRRGSLDSLIALV